MIKTCDLIILLGHKIKYHKHDCWLYDNECLELTKVNVTQLYYQQNADV